MSLNRIALSILILVSTGCPVWAQTPQRAAPSLEAALTPGMAAWITVSGAREQETRIVSVGRDVVTVTAGGAVRRLPVADITRISVRRSDSVLNGALIGAGAAVASGLVLCSLTETWESCRDDVGPMLRIGAIGAGVGIGIDALIRGRRTIYDASAASTRLRAVPLVARRAGGLKVTLSF